MRVVVSTGVMFRYSKPHSSRPSTDDSKLPLPSQIPLRGDAFSLLSLFCDIFSRCLRNVWTCLLVLALSFLWLALWCSFARHVALPGPPNEMKHILKERQHEMPGRQLSHTRTPRRHHSEKREPRPSPTHRSTVFVLQQL